MNGFMHVGRDDEDGVEGAPAAAREGDADDTHLRRRINRSKPGLKINGFCLRHVDARGRRDGLEELRFDEVELGLLKRLTR